MSSKTEKSGALKLVAGYYKPHRVMFCFDMVCAMVVAACDLFYPQIAKNIMNDYVYRDTLSQIFLWGGIMLLIYLIRAAANYYMLSWGHIMGARIQHDMRRDMFSHLQKLPFSFFDSNRTGSIMSRIVNDLQEITELAHHGPENIFISCILLIGSFIMLARINVLLTLILFIFVPFIVLFSLKLQKKLIETSMAARKRIADINATLESGISGIRVSRSYTAEAHERSKFGDAIASYVEAASNRYQWMAIFHCGTAFLMDILYLAVLLAGGVFLYKGRINAGEFTAFILYISQFTKPVSTLLSIFEQLQDGVTGIRRFSEIMAVPEEETVADPIRVDQLQGNIRFDKVTFSYDVTDEDGNPVKPVIRDLSMDIPKGRTVALVGPSGGGKTTLCHLIPRFYEVDEGTISIDGIDITRMDRVDLRRNIGMVAQDVFLYNGTIRENIAYGNLEATEEQIMEAAKKANIHDYILTLPDGYDTNVGERGVKLSGGQKQRISIARVFLKDPSILILDEATSALDNATEMLIQESLEKLSEGRTCLVVAHRLSTIKHADEIIVIGSEGIQERGSHEALLAKNGIYAGLYQYQFRE
ncbi:MAG: ABC transporter ATP-binding protein [Lachnospiraceae bacterium]|nr:ABC transporter ATP-binding protein [Lachnospiraceae bacterium]